MQKFNSILTPLKQKKASIDQAILANDPIKITLATAEIQQIELKAIQYMLEIESRYSF